MKKSIKIVSLCLAIVMFVSLLSACSTSRKFVGTWEEIDSNGTRAGETLVLANDGTGSVKEQGLSGTVNWSVEKDKIFITVSACGMTDTQEFFYRFSGDTLILTDAEGEEHIYRRANFK